MQLYKWATIAIAALLLGSPCAAQLFEPGPTGLTLQEILESTADAAGQIGQLTRRLGEISEGDSDGVDQPTLRGLLQHQELTVRAAAIRAWLEVSGDLKPARAMLNDPQAVPCRAAALALLDRGVKPETLLPLLRHESSMVRTDVGVAMVESGIDHTKVLRLLTDRSAKVRGGIAVALIKAGIPHRHVMPLLEDPDNYVRESVVRALVEAGIHERHVLPLLRDEVAEVRDAVVEELMLRGLTLDRVLRFRPGQSNFAHNDLETAITSVGGNPRSFAFLLTDESGEPRPQISLDTLRRACDPESVVALLDNEDPSVATLVAHALLRRNYAEIGKPLNTLLKHRELDEEFCRYLGPRSRVWFVQELDPDANSVLDRNAAIYDVLLRLPALPPQAVPKLRKLLRHESGFVRSRACRLLARVGEPARAALPELRTCLRREDSATVLRALETLSLLDLTEAVPAIRQSYTHQSPDIRRAAALAVAKLDEADTECVQILLQKTAGRTDEEVLQDLRKVGQRGLVASDFLRRCIADARPAIDGFDNGRLPRAVVAACQVLAGTVPESHAIVREWLADPDSSALLKTRLLSFHHRLDVNGDQLRDVIAPLLNSEDRALRTSATYALMDVGVADPVRLLSSKAGKDPALGWATARALATCPEDRRDQAIAGLRRLLGANNFKVRMAACEGLTRFGVVEPVIPVLVDAVRNDMAKGYSLRQPVHACTKQLGARALPILPALLTKKKVPLGPSVEKWALILEPIGEAAIPRLVAGLSDNRAEIRGLSATALGKVGDSEVIKPLSALLNDDDEYDGRMVGRGRDRCLVRVDALRAIAQLKPTSRLQPKLISMLVKDEDARPAVIDALAAIGPAAERSLPFLRRYQNAEYREFEVLRAIVCIENNRRKRISALRTAMSVDADWFGEDEIPVWAKLLLEFPALSRSLIPELAYRVEAAELLDPWDRAHAACVLGFLDPDNTKKWAAHARRITAYPDFFDEGIETQLKRLEELQASGRTASSGRTNE